MHVTHFRSPLVSERLKTGSYTWASPSNIALVKYWGKKDIQIPTNPSASFTLNHCKTKTTLHFSEKEEETTFSFKVFLEGELQTDFYPKIQSFFERVIAYLPFLKSYHFNIKTSNSFPHSSGIASSASGMSALALCLMSMDRALTPNMTDDFFYQKASFIARLGSGSACRSIEGPLVVWGEHEAIEGSSNLYGIKYPYTIHPNFNNYQDTILLVDNDQKEVSSTLGHKLMRNHPFAEERFKLAHSNVTRLKTILESGNLHEFINLVEQEALSLHAMMMTSTPYFVLMKPNTLHIIHEIWKFRKETGGHICFTLDAGANVHVLYPESEKSQILKFIKEKLVAYCQNDHYICDNVGFGAQLNNAT